MRILAPLSSGGKLELARIAKKGSSRHGGSMASPDFGHWPPLLFPAGDGRNLFLGGAERLGPAGEGLERAECRAALIGAPEADLRTAEDFRPVNSVRRRVRADLADIG
jgi:hypothetical protein